MRRCASSAPITLTSTVRSFASLSWRTTHPKCLVIHWPVAFKASPNPGKDLFPPHPTKKGWVEVDTETPLVETWQAMIELKKTGKVKAIGVSNFTIDQIQGIVDATGVWPVSPLPSSICIHLC